MVPTMNKQAVIVLGAIELSPPSFSFEQSHLKSIIFSFSLQKLPILPESLAVQSTRRSLLLTTTTIVIAFGRGKSPFGLGFRIIVTYFYKIKYPTCV